MVTPLASKRILLENKSLQLLAHTNDLEIFSLAALANT